MKAFSSIVVAAALTVSAQASAATSVNSSTSTPTLVAALAAGQYQVTVTGLIDLAGPLNSGFTVDANGVPFTPVTTPGYGYFNPNGSPLDGSNPGPAGGSINLGALVGTFNPSPSGPGDYFLIGTGTVLNLVAPATLYAQVNDTFYSNNTGSFVVNVSAVPEPSSWALMIAGFAVVGYAMRRRRQTVTTTVRFA